MPNLQAQAYAQDFAADGGTSGNVQVADSSGFYVGTIGYLCRDDAGARVIIVDIPDANHVGVRIIADDNESQASAQRYGGKSNLTGWTTALHSRLSMPAQLAHYEPAFVKPNKLNV